MAITNHGSSGTIPYGITATTHTGIPALTMEDVEILKRHTIVSNDVLPIKGEPVVATLIVDDATLANTRPDPNNIKEMLVTKLVNEMYKCDHIEFTKEEKFTHGETIFRARIFITPKDVTQLLRVNKAITA